MHQPRLILFDIDCTLLRTGGAGMAALTRALGEVLQQPLLAESPVRPDGKTDPNIVRLMLQHQGVPPSQWPELESAILQAYPALLEEVLQERKELGRLEAGA